MCIFADVNNTRAEGNKDLDTCLKFTLWKRTNVQFYGHYFPPQQSHEIYSRVNKDLAQSVLYKYQGESVYAVCLLKLRVLRAVLVGE
jgi:hypothetical protein